MTLLEAFAEILGLFILDDAVAELGWVGGSVGDVGPLLGRMDGVHDRPKIENRARKKKASKRRDGFKQVMRAMFLIVVAV